MSKISLKNLRHSYYSDPQIEEDWALQELNIDWSDGGAYALLGPSGCGKTTLLNLISGLLSPTEGEVWFGDQDVSQLPPDSRNIAQVFQFPVVYDTMTVYDNLAFPLRNRGVHERQIDKKVREIADMLDLGETLMTRAAGLTADGKQKISLGRGLVRSDVNAILFDEPLTVIDPHLKWVLRSKLKELHQQIRTTMIYVTHDQTEALTFADQVVVMQAGKVVQIGTPIDLFERPLHTFVGHFIGSPGMNVLPCTVEQGQPVYGGLQLEKTTKVESDNAASKLEVGIRPEFISFAGEGIPVTVEKVSDAGRFSIVETRHQNDVIKLLVPEGGTIPSENAHLKFDPDHTQIYANDWMVS